MHHQLWLRHPVARLGEHLHAHRDVRIWHAWHRHARHARRRGLPHVYIGRLRLHCPHIDRGVEPGRHGHLGLHRNLVLHLERLWHARSGQLNVRRAIHIVGVEMVQLTRDLLYALHLTALHCKFKLHFEHGASFVVIGRWHPHLWRCIGHQLRGGMHGGLNLINKVRDKSLFLDSRRERVEPGASSHCSCGAIAHFLPDVATLGGDVVLGHDL